MMRFALKTLGCKVNQAESDQMITSVRSSGWEWVSFQHSADVYIINSCAVTREAERKTGQYVRRALRRNPWARVYLTGCLARKIGPDVLSPFGERVEVLTSRDKLSELLSRMEVFSGQRLTPVETPMAERTRIWLKVQDGCDHHCAYCIVPRLRGPVSSVTPEMVQRTVVSLEKAGCREIVLCGINLGYYGKEQHAPGLIDLLEMLVRFTSRVRFRLSSLEPFAAGADFIERYFDLGDRVCPHFHLPLQSGSDRILFRMNRGYTTRDFAAIVDRIRRRNPLAAVTTDMMVGFPGETESLFRETADFFQAMQFARTHLFVFSPRPGTPAEALDRAEKVSQPDKRRREKILRQMADASRAAYQEQFLHKTVTVLIESMRKGVGYGHSEQYLDVLVPGVNDELCGQMVEVKAEAIEEGVVKGRYIAG